MENEKIKRGRAGEDMAARLLESKGYSIIGRNWRVREGEIDIIAARGDIVAFVEVKWRRNDRFAAPGESVTAKKRARLRRAAAMWMAEHGEKNARFDVVEIVAGDDGGDGDGKGKGRDPAIRHIVGAFA